MSFLSKLVRSVAPVVSTVAPFFGPVGMAAGAVAAAVSSRGAPAPAVPSFALPGGAPTPFAGPTGLPLGLPGGFPGAPQLGGILPTLGRALPLVGGLVGGAVRAAAGLVRTAAGRIRGVVLASGRFVSSRKGALLARRVGIDAAAAALGISAVELAEMVLSEEERRGRRRSRGVSGADLRRTRRTINTIERMHDQIVRACRDANVPRRSRRIMYAQRALPPHRHKLISVK